MSELQLLYSDIESPEKPYIDNYKPSGSKTKKG